MIFALRNNILREGLLEWWNLLRLLISTFFSFLSRYCSTFFSGGFSQITSGLSFSLHKSIYFVAFREIVRGRLTLMLEHVVDTVFNHWNLNIFWVIFARNFNFLVGSGPSLSMDCASIGMDLSITSVPILLLPITRFLHSGASSFFGNLRTNSFASAMVPLVLQIFCNWFERRFLKFRSQSQATERLF